MIGKNLKNVGRFKLLLNTRYVIMHVYIQNFFVEYSQFSQFSFSNSRYSKIFELCAIFIHKSFASDSVAVSILDLTPVNSGSIPDRSIFFYRRV